MHPKLGYYVHKLKKAFEIMEPVLKQIPRESPLRDF